MAAASSASYASTVLADNPIQYFQLNESSGPTARDSSATAVNGTYIGAVAYGAAGPLENVANTAVSLAGGSASVGVRLPNPGIQPGASFSVETWVLPAASGSAMAIWGYDASHSVVLNANGHLVSSFYGSFVSKRALSLNSWHQVVFVYNAPAQSQSFYIDGTLDSSAVLPAASAAFNVSYYAGQYDSGSAGKWNGGLAQLSSYNAALTQTQIIAHYDAAGYVPVCGDFRWQVKTAMDSGANSIATGAAQSSTIAALDALPAPSSLSDTTPRITGVETTLYQLTNVTLVEVLQEHDQDLHLYLRDAQGGTMIAEDPSPACAPASALYTPMSAVRQALIAQYPALASGTTVTPGTQVTLQGVGFFDEPDITGSEAPNGIELHALTAICFGANCALSGAPPAASPTPSPSPATTVSGAVTYAKYYSTTGGFQISTPASRLVWVYGPQPYTAPLAPGVTVSAAGHYNAGGSFIATTVNIAPANSLTGAVTYARYYSTNGSFQVKTSAGQLVWVYGPAPYTAFVTAGATIVATGSYNHNGAFIASMLTVSP
jgi:hypothetical protein